MKRPEIGTRMYHVIENYYRPTTPDGAAGLVEMEFVVREVEVQDYFTLGFTEICTVGENGHGHMTPYRFRMGDIGKKLFFTPKEAAVKALMDTERYEMIWGRIDKKAMRRTWEQYLKNDDEYYGLFHQTDEAPIYGNYYKQRHQYHKMAQDGLKI